MGIKKQDKILDIKASSVAQKKNKASLVVQKKKVVESSPNTTLDDFWWQYKTLVDSARGNENDVNDFPVFIPIPKDHVPFRSYDIVMDEENKVLMRGKSESRQPSLISRHTV